MRAEASYAAEVKNGRSSWNPLYRAAAVAAIVTVAFIPIQIAVFILWPPPGFQPTISIVMGYFSMLHDHRLLGLLDLDLLLVADNVLAIPIVLALYLALRRTSQAGMLMATALGLGAIAAYLASNGAFAMLSLSNQYAAATTDAQKALFLSAGLGIIASSTGTPFHISYILGSIGLAITAVVMIRSTVFSRLTVWAGLLGSVIGLGLYVPRIGIFLSVISVPFLALWNILIARGLIRLAGATARDRVGVN